MYVMYLCREVRYTSPVTSKDFFLSELMLFGRPCSVKWVTFLRSYWYVQLFNNVDL